VRLLPGLHWIGARFWLDGKRIPTRVFHGRIGADLDMRGLKKKIVRVRIRAIDQHRRVHRHVRVYHTCIQKRPHTIPDLRTVSLKGWLQSGM
jgi:hypothetical protein